MTAFERFAPAPAPDARLECGVCWHVYDPAEGDPVWQIAPGTPFADLPAHWRCPQCDAPKARFLALDEPATAAASVGEQALEVALRTLADGPMRDLPIANPRLSVELVGFRDVAQGRLGVAIAPWSINAILLTAESAPVGTSRDFALPSGLYDFLAGEYAGVGAVWALSLFSPCLEFADQDAARAAASAALDELVRPPMPTPPPAPANVSRRAFFGRGEA